MDKENEEKLLEAACFGDFETLKLLIDRGVNVNTKNEVNGWTALHWASKRGHYDIVKFLLLSGAAPCISSYKGETPASVTTNEKVLDILKEAGSEISTATLNQPELVNTQNYIRETPVCLKVELPKAPKPPTIMAPPITNPLPTTVCVKGTQTDEVVLKVRLANTGDPDFIEVEIPRHEMTFSRLLRTVCEELGINAQQVVRVRKLPDTIVRKDKDVQRLIDFQELEIVVSGSEKSSWGGTSTLAMNGFRPMTMSRIRNQTILY